MVFVPGLWILLTAGCTEAHRVEVPSNQRHELQSTHIQGLLAWLSKGGFKVSSGTVEWHISSCGVDFANSKIASPDIDSTLRPKYTGVGLSFCSLDKEIYTRVRIVQGTRNITMPEIS